jgi:hypothetical protein
MKNRGRALRPFGRMVRMIQYLVEDALGVLADIAVGLRDAARRKRRDGNRRGSSRR